MYCVVGVFGNDPSGNRLFLTDRSPTTDAPIVVDQKPAPNTYGENQLWIPIYSFSYVFWNQAAFALLNKATGNLLQFTGNNALVGVLADSAENEGLNSVLMNPVVPDTASGEISALRSFQTGDFSQNLNVSGGTNQTPPIEVLFFDWGGGAENEIWTIYRVDGVDG